MKNKYVEDKSTDRKKKSLMLAVLLSMLAALTVTAFADEGYMSWLTPFESLVDSLISFMAIIGKGLLGWALFEVATALFSHDTSQMPQALRRIGGGTILIFVQTIISSMTSAGSGAAAATTEGASNAVLAVVHLLG